MGKDLIQIRLETLVKNGWFRRLQEEFTMNFALNCKDLTSENLFTTYVTEYDWTERAALTARGRAYLVAEIFKNLNIVAENLWADYNDNYGPKLAYIEFEFNNKVYELEAKEFNISG